MLWKSKNCKIEPLTGRWDKKIVSMMPLRINDQDMYYSGSVLSTHHVPETEGMIEFNITTTSLKPANMILTVASNDAVDVLLEIVDHKIEQSIQIEPSNDNNYRGKITTFDIIETAACVRTLKIRLQCKFHNINSEFHILLDHKNENLPGLQIQKFNLTYFLSMLSIQTTLWLTLLAILFLIAAHFPFIQNINRQYAAIELTIIWFVALLGFPNLVQLPIKLRPQSVLRRISCFFRKSPKLALSMLPIILLFLYTPIHNIIGCISVKNEYNSHIMRYSEERTLPDLIKAFSLIPQRQEAMILIESHLLSLSTETDTRQLRNEAKQFLDDKSVKESINVHTRKYHNCLCEYSKSPLDPKLWYATVLPMAESHHETKRKQEARDLLDGRNDPKARLFSYILALEISRIDKETEIVAAEIVEKMEQIIDDDEILDSHLYQEAADHIAQYKISQCAVDEAIDWYYKLLEKRKVLAESDGSNKKWMRTPRKLSLFHIFRAMDSDHRKGETTSEARKLLEHCKNEDLENKLRKEIYEVFGSYQDEDKWYTRTLIRQKGRNIRDIIKQDYLPNCWKY